MNGDLRGRSLDDDNVGQDAVDGVKADDVDVVVVTAVMDEFACQVHGAESLFAEDDILVRNQGFDLIDQLPAMGSLNGMDDRQVPPLLGGQVVLLVRVHRENLLPGEVPDELGDVRDQRLGTLGAKDAGNEVVLNIDDKQEIAVGKFQAGKIHFITPFVIKHAVLFDIYYAILWENIECHYKFLPFTVQPSFRVNCQMLCNEKRKYKLGNMGLKTHT